MSVTAEERGQDFVVKYLKFVTSHLLHLDFRLCTLQVSSAVYTFTGE
jgi:hypothetical protein